MAASLSLQESRARSFSDTMEEEPALTLASAAMGSQLNGRYKPLTWTLLTLHSTARSWQCFPIATVSALLTVFSYSYSHRECAVSGGLQYIL